jgi:hypothetical protein
MVGKWWWSEPGQYSNPQAAVLPSDALAQHALALCYVPILAVRRRHGRGASHFPGPDGGSVKHENEQPSWHASCIEQMCWRGDPNAHSRKANLELATLTLEHENEPGTLLAVLRASPGHHSRPSHWLGPSRRGGVIVVG